MRALLVRAVLLLVALPFALGALLAISGCTPSASTAARTTANAIHAIGEVAGEVVDACATQLDQIDRGERPGTPEQLDQLTTACDAVVDAYIVTQRAHAALRAAILAAEAAEDLHTEPNWATAAAAGASALDAVAKARAAVEAYEAAYRRRSGS